MAWVGDKRRLIITLATRLAIGPHPCLRGFLIHQEEALLAHSQISYGREHRCQFAVKIRLTVAK